MAREATRTAEESAPEGAAGARANMPGWRRTPIGAGDLVLALVIAGLAFLARWPFIVHGEVMLQSDEAIVGLMAEDIAEGRSLPIYFYGQRYMGALEAYIVAALRPVFADPLISLRVGPTLCFALLCAVQYLMLTRWLGRQAGLTGAALLILSAPMFVQWSISARGGYIEILLWGTALWWAYTEWFVAPVLVACRRPLAACGWRRSGSVGVPTATAPLHAHAEHGCRQHLAFVGEGMPPSPGRRTLRQAIFGVILGSGQWVNPMIVIFLAPVIVHALLDRPLTAARQDARLGRCFLVLDRMTCGLPITLPVLALLILVGISAIFCVEVHGGEVHYLILFGLLPKRIGMAVVGVLALTAAVLLCRFTPIVAWARQGMRDGGPLILGVFAGSLPSVAYVLRSSLSGRPLENSLPLGLRPIWSVSETLTYFRHGLPVFLGADVQPFFDLVLIGRPYELHALSPRMTQLIGIGDWLVLAGLVIAAGVVLANWGGELARMLRLEPGVYAPTMLLVLALCGLLTLYLSSGAAINMTSVRYLVPLWAILPGLLASAVVAERGRWLARAAVVVVLGSWLVGQIGFFERLGAPHPLRNVAAKLREKQVPFALAEILDAHVLSFLTQQEPKIGEFDPFWPRLGWYREGMPPGAPMRYVVEPSEVDWTVPWHQAGWPGNVPPETVRILWPRLAALQRTNPDAIVSIEPLADGYELWTLREPLPEEDRTKR